MRCINIDWLEVFVKEPDPCNLDAEYFSAQGYKVVTRAYGTPQYREMFTIYKGDFPFIEVRRSPYSLKSQGGIFENGAAHLRLTNYACYLENPIKELRNFLFSFSYSLQSISRVDLCLDFLKFDDGKDPGLFLVEYAKGDYFKNHLSKISPRGVEIIGSDFHGAGVDSPYQRSYNSWSWGSKKSAISVKLYNKTQELYEVKDKPYIRSQWLNCGLITNDDLVIMQQIRDNRYYIGMLKRQIKKSRSENCASLKKLLQEKSQILLQLKDKEKQIWRLEFSLKSDIKGFISGDERDIDRYGNRKIYPLMLSTIESRSKCLFLFYALSNRYFEFKQLEYTRTGSRQRKDRCPSYYPIAYNKNSDYKPARITYQAVPSRIDKIIINKLRRIVEDNNINGGKDEKFVQAVIMVLQYFKELYRFDELDKVVNTNIIKSDDKLLEDTAVKEEYISKVLLLINRIEALNNKNSV